VKGQAQAIAAAESGRGWAWAALVCALVLWLGAIVTFGMTVLLSPLSLALTAVAWRRAPHDAVFWLGGAFNALLALALLSFLIGVVTGDVGVGWE
jgi:hypothetical protein